MDTSLESPTKKAKLNVQISEESGCKSNECSDNLLTHLRRDKFQLLLPVIYNLNKSHTKSVIIGLQLEYETHKVKPVVGIFDQKYKGVILTEESWKEFAACFENINLFLDCDNNGKFANQIDQPFLHTGFSVTFSYLSFNWVKSKALCIREQGKNSVEMDKDSSTIVMQKITFDVLRELKPLITEYLSYLNGMIPCAEECIKTLLDYAKMEINNIQAVTDTSQWSNEVLQRIARDCFPKFKVGGMEKVDSEIAKLNYKRMMNELYVFYDEFMVYSVLNSL